MKYILSIAALLFIVGTANAQRVKRKGVTPIDVSKNKRAKEAEGDYSLQQFQGKWQEIKRTSKKNGKKVDIVDTIYMNFTEENKVYTREGNKPNLKGEAEVGSDNTLTAAADLYDIKSVSASQIVLDDQEKFVHTFTKVDSFWFEKVGNLKVAIDTFKTVTEVNANNLIGDWMVYRRQAKPGEVKAPTMFIKYLKIKTKTNETTLAGVITVYQKDQSEELPCTITVYKTGMQIVAGTYSWYMPVYKDDGKELVFGNAELMLNYCKPL